MRRNLQFSIPFIPRLFLVVISLTAAGGMLSACTPSSTPEPPPTNTPLPVSTPTPADPYFQSDGGGEPRSAGYWMLWNSCAEDNRADVAATNGGPEAGWYLMDDLLADPGIQLGELPVGTCTQGLNLLQGLTLDGTDPGEDAAYPLAAQLLTAHLNLSLGSEFCPAAGEVLQVADLLLLTVAFDGISPALGADAPADQRQLAGEVTQLLAEYNAGGLCR